MNKKRLSILSSVGVVVSFLFFCGIARCSEEVKSENVKKKNIEGSASPDIQFEEREYDFGSIEQYEKVSHIFKFKNSGDGILKIQEVGAGCDCVAVLLSSAEIFPDERGEIKVTFDAGDRQAYVKKTIFVLSNDSDNPMVKLRIKAFVKADVIVKPRRISFGEFEKGSTITKELHILQGKDKDVEIVDIESVSPYVTISEAVPVLIEDKKGYEIDVGLGPEVPIGRFSSNIIIHTNLTTVKVPVNAKVRGDIVVDPVAVVFTFSLEKKRTFKTLKVSTVLDEKLKIEKVITDVKSLSFDISSTEEGRSYIITVYLIADDLLDKSVKSIKGTIEIHTNYSMQPIIKVPAYIFNHKKNKRI